MKLTRATSYGPMVARHAGGILAMVFGFAALLAGFWTQFGTERAITEVPDLRIVLPLAGAALVAGVVAFIRKERQQSLAIGGLAMAAAAPILGWVVLVAVVAATAVLVMLIVAKFQ
jgi:hypothetical protein